jgi:hypothetical protein
MRDENQFPLVLRENMAYGFRRNLWGRKPYGIAAAAATLAVSGGLLVAAAAGQELVPWEGAAFVAGYAAVALLTWIAAITPDWVREAAEAYATRLLESAVRLDSASG